MVNIEAVTGLGGSVDKTLNFGAGIGNKRSGRGFVHKMSRIKIDYRVYWASYKVKLIIKEYE